MMLRVIKIKLVRRAEKNKQNVKMIDTNMKRLQCCE